MTNDNRGNWAALEQAARETAIALDCIHSELAELQAKQPTLRDQFAMAVLQGLLASPQMWHKTELTEAIYEIADAMLAAREVGNE